MPECVTMAAKKGKRGKGAKCWNVRIRGHRQRMCRTRKGARFVKSK